MADTKSPTGKRSSTSATGATLHQYFVATRDPKNALLFVLPLFVTYQIGILLLGGVRNGADFITPRLWALVDGQVLVYLAVNGLVLAVGTLIFWRMRAKAERTASMFPWLLFESAIYGMAFGSIVLGILRALGLGGLVGAGMMVDATTMAVAPLAASSMPAGPIGVVVMSAGAGLYEEIVFRVALMGGMFTALTRLANVGRVPSAIVAVLLSSVIFSFVHHLGNMGEAFTLSAFTFRFMAGVVLAVIYHLRGLAVAAYTHAIYDVLVMGFGGD